MHYCTGPQNTIIREAVPEDAKILGAMGRGEQFHTTRIEGAKSGEYRYFVVERDGEIAGHALLVLHQPKNWPKITHLPQMFDMFILPSRRGQGLGCALLEAVEQSALTYNEPMLWLAVERDENSRAFEFYLRRGYLPEPSDEAGSLITTYSNGNIRGQGGLVYLSKRLT